MLPSTLQKVVSQEGETLKSRNIKAVFVYKPHAIGIAIKGDPRICANLLHSGL
jgi:hypothetical protein